MGLGAISPANRPPEPDDAHAICHHRLDLGRHGADGPALQVTARYRPRPARSDVLRGRPLLGTRRLPLAGPARRLRWLVGRLQAPPPLDRLGTFGGALRADGRPARL